MKVGSPATAEIRGIVLDQTRLQVLRSIDKKDRIGIEGVFDLLTVGRKDQSGDWTPGVGLTSAQAGAIVAFLLSGEGDSEGRRIANRMRLMCALEEIEVGGGFTAWDRFLSIQPNEDQTWGKRWPAGKHRLGIGRSDRCLSKQPRFDPIGNPTWTGLTASLRSRRSRKTRA